MIYTKAVVPNPLGTADRPMLVKEIFAGAGDPNSYNKTV